MSHPTFSLRSRLLLKEAHPDLERLFQVALRVGMDFTVLEAHRGEEDQNAALETGRSRVGWPDSAHNLMPSHAVDVAPWPVRWKEIDRFYHLAGIIRAVAFDLAIPIRWGGDWDGDWNLHDQSLFDLGHYELLENQSTEG